MIKSELIANSGMTTVKGMSFQQLSLDNSASAAPRPKVTKNTGAWRSVVRRVCCGMVLEQ